MPISRIITDSLATAAATTVKGGTGLSVPGTSGNVLTSNGTIWTSSPPATPTSLTTNNWTVAEVGGKLVFSFGGVARLSFDSSGNMLTLGNVTAAATSV